MAAVSYSRRLADLAEERKGSRALTVAGADGSQTEATWDGLDRLASQVAAQLSGLGLRSGAFAAVALPSSLEHVVATMAIWRLGACPVPLRADVPAWERDRLMAAIRPAVVVGRWHTEVPTLDPGAPAPVATTSDGPLPDLAAQPSYAIATSGSTGNPRLLVNDQPAVWDPDADVGSPTSAIGALVGVQLVPAPLYHTNGFALTFRSLLGGSQVVLMERFDGERALRLIEDHRVTSFTAAPIMLARMVKSPYFEGADLSSLRTVIQGAAPCPPWLLRRWIDKLGPERIFVMYGATESVGLTCVRGDEWLRHPGTVGKGFRTDVAILDAAGNPLPAGTIGEIFLRPELARPLTPLGGPPITARNGFLSVGDLGHLDEDGYLYLADRRTDMVISGGANVYPAEVEAALLEHPQVADAAVIGLPDEEWGQRVHAVVEPAQPGDPPNAQDLSLHCKRRLASYKVPKSFTIAKLPRTAAGKLNRTRLAEELSLSEARS